MRATSENDEDPEEDPEEDPAEDPEEDPAEDPEEDLAEEPIEPHLEQSAEPNTMTSLAMIPAPLSPVYIKISSDNAMSLIEVQLLGIFYRGMEWRHQMTLDASSNGNFKTRFPIDCLELIKNVSTSNSTKKKIDEERKREAGMSGGAKIAEVKAKIDFIHHHLVNKKSVHFAQEVDTFYQDEDREQEDVNYINQNGYQSQHYGNQSENKGYNGYNQRSSFGSNINQRNYGSSSYQPIPATSSENDAKAMFEQLLEGLHAQTVNLNEKIDGLYTDLIGKIGSLCTDLNGKIEALNIHMKKLDTQVAQTAENVRKQKGFLPGKTDMNPKHFSNPITLKSEEQVIPTIEKCEDEDWLVVLEKDMELEIAKCLSIDTPLAVDRHQDLTAIGKQTLLIDTHMGAMVDFPNKRISFSNINRNVFYPSVLVTSASCMSVNVGDTLGVGDETKKVQNVLKLAPSTTHLEVNNPASSKCQKIPKVKRIKTSKPFSKFRIVIHLEFREKEEVVVQEMLNNTMKLFPGIVPYKSGGVHFKDPPPA
ncbi:hypothetical protein AALP_AA7G104900 [Arabis alpina]|uniref:Uncharacterized protein n=1 Tax=Arabis alpina TaxID=50452 RepID=A0A087GH68_ARAAL|nr:hypothetical protein AALP_AA7G104900 [Arabis alpina]